MEAKEANFHETIKDVYSKVSKEIHAAGYDEIPIVKEKFNAQEIELIKALCEVAKYKYKEI